MDIRSIHLIKTAENVDIEVELAGAASRLYAFLIDALVMFTLMAILTLGLGLSFTFTSEIFKTAVPISTLLVFFGFHMVQEWLFNGKTIGKNMLSIRVVRNNGQPIGFWEAFGRNLLRTVDVYFSGIGLLVMMISKQEKRFGDYLAGTLVINDQAITKPRWLLKAGPEQNTLSEGSITLSGEETELLNAYLSRRKKLFKTTQKLLNTELQTYFAKRLNKSPEESQTPDFLERLYQESQPLKDRDSQ